MEEAINEVWDSCFSFRANAYSEQDIKMGVIIQRMIKAKYSGVAFSKHPFPSTVYENQNYVIEFAAMSGEKVVQGEVTPFRLSGSLDHILQATDSIWIPALLKSLLTLKENLHHEVDIEFAVDDRETFWLLQQRPISTAFGAHAFDLSFYQRKYKRSLLSLDIELLIEGCSLFLPFYLEIPYQFDRWMVMTTSQDGAQELWTHKLLEEATILKMVQKIREDDRYLKRIYERYEFYHNYIQQYDYTQFQQKDVELHHLFYQFIEFILPIEAHYYVPIFMIEALHRFLFEETQKVDSENAEKDLFFLGTWNVASLVDLLHGELEKILSHYDVLPGHFEELSIDEQKKLKNLAEHFGFLKCHQIDEKGYTAEEFFSQFKTLSKEEKKSPPVEEFERIKEKYSLKKLDVFRLWMRIRNQEMEYLYYALCKSRPLFEAISHKLDISIKELWNASRASILESLKRNQTQLIREMEHENLIIFKNYGKVRLANRLRIVLPEVEKEAALRGKTVYGTGNEIFKVKIAFHPNELEEFHSDQPYVLVTGMTTPDFIPYLKKSFKALVTDEGGILCHAAIVAREIPIACVVGTGRATEMLKDQQKVEIYFDHGEIFVID